MCIRDRIYFIEAVEGFKKIPHDLVTDPISPYDEIQLSFQYKDEDEIQQVLSFNINKELNFISHN